MVLDIFGGQPGAPPKMSSTIAWHRESPVLDSPPFPAPPQTWRTSAGSGLPANGADSSTPSRTAATPPRPRSTAASPLSNCPSIAPAPPPQAATCGLRFFLLLDLLSTTIPLSSEGSLTACSSFLPSFGTNVTQFIDREEGGGNRRTFKHFNNKINKHKIKAAAPHGRLPHIKHK